MLPARTPDHFSTGWTRDDRGARHQYAFGRLTTGATPPEHGRRPRTDHRARRVDRRVAGALRTRCARRTSPGRAHPVLRDRDPDPVQERVSVGPRRGGKPRGPVVDHISAVHPARSRRTDRYLEPVGHDSDVGVLRHPDPVAGLFLRRGGTRLRHHRHVHRELVDHRGHDRSRPRRHRGTSRGVHSDLRRGGDLRSLSR